MSVSASTTVSTVPRADRLGQFVKRHARQGTELARANAPASAGLCASARGVPPTARAQSAAIQSRRWTGESAINTLAGLRLAIGVASWATPRAAGKLFGLDATANPQAPYLARLFGARDVALALGHARLPRARRSASG